MRISDWSSDVCSSDLFDTAFSELTTYGVLQIVDDLYDVILKKCHWLDGQYEMRSLELPFLLTPDDLQGDEKWDRMFEAYRDFKEEADGVTAPQGKGHGDRNSVVMGRSVSVRLALGGVRNIKKKTISVTRSRL